MDITEVARKGGNSTLQRYGVDHYKKMGQLKKGKKSPGSGRRAKLGTNSPIDRI